MNRALSTFLVLVSLLVAGCATDRKVIDQADEAHTQLEPAVMHDPELASYLQKIGDRIVSVAKERSDAGYGPPSHFKEKGEWMFSDEMRFHFVNSETLNAFTTGGEHMYIYSELVESCRSEDELAAVMAHEYAHVYARHVHKGMNRQYLVLGGSALAGVGGYLAGGDDHGLEYGAGAATLAYAAGSFLGMGFTRDDEAEADEIGFELYTRAGWDPAKFGDFFQQMIDKGLDTTPEMMSDHPTLASRVEAAKKRAANLPAEAKSWRQPPIAAPAAFANLQKRVDVVARSMPKGESEAVAATLLSSVPSCLLPVDQPEQKAAQEKLRQAAAAKP